MGKRNLIFQNLFFWRSFLLVSALFFLCVSLWADAPQQEDKKATLSELSSEIHGTLDGLKRQSMLLTIQLKEAESESARQSEQVKALKIRLAELSTSLESTNQLLSDYSTKLTEYEMKLRRRAKIIAGFAVLLALAVAVRIVLSILAVKFHIKIPYWLNLIL